MDRYYLENWELVKGVQEAASKYIKSCSFDVQTIINGVKLVGYETSIVITLRYGEYSFSLINNRTEIEYSLTDLILKIYPNYFTDNKTDIFKKENQFKSYFEYFKHLVENSFKFVEKHYSKPLYKGDFSAFQ